MACDDARPDVATVQSGKIFSGGEPRKSIGAAVIYSIDNNNWL
jgi:hypothetical protein